MAEKILITGGAGFIGLNLARALVAREAQVTLVDNFSRGALDADLQALLPHVHLIEYDLTKPICNGVIGNDYTQVYHLAAVVGVGTSNQAPHRVLRTNLLTMLNVLDWCAQLSKLVVCFASSSETYAGSIHCGQASIPTPETVPLTIAHPAIPRFSYAASKIIGELLFLNYGRAFGFTVRIVRYHNVYGPRMGYAHVVPQFVQRIVARQNPFNIYGAYQSRAFCYVDDAVEATIQLMELPTAEPLIVNVGNNREEIQIKDLAHKLFTIADFYPDLKINPPPPGSPERRCPNIDYLQRLTDYEPMVDLESGLRRTYHWYRQDLKQQAAVKT
jgi:UDP-glucuronate decarboxylase